MYQEIKEIGEEDGSNVLDRRYAETVDTIERPRNEMQPLELQLSRILINLA